MTRIIAGPNAVEEALKEGRSHLEVVYVLSGLSQKTAARIFALGERRRINVESVPLSRLDAIAGDTRHQGVIAIAGEFTYTPLETILCAGVAATTSVIAVLDQVQDPGNLGAIVRTARCLDATGVVITKDRSCAMTPGAVRASAGASELLPVSRVGNLATAMGQIRDAGFAIFGAAADADVSVDELEWPSRVAVVLGNEGKGLRRLTVQNCDRLFAIPMPGGFESLNVSASAAIALFQVARYHRRTAQ